MQLPELRMSFTDRALLAVEIEQSLRCGRAYLSQRSPVPVLTDCVLVLVHPEHGGELRLPAQVVMANEHGTGLSLTTLTAQHLSELSAFPDSAAPPTAEAASTRPSTTPPAASTTPPAASTPPRVSANTEPPSAAAMPTTRPAEAASALPASVAPPSVAATTQPSAAASMTPTAADDAGPTQSAAGTQPLESAEVSANADSRLLGGQGETPEPLDGLDFPRCDEQELQYGDEPSGGSSHPVELQAAETRHERLRHLNAAEQLKVARRGELADRLAVERMYGKQVWEALLHNPRLTIPEVAKIARKGTVPKPVLDIILDNAGWIKADAVRRALLSNPKIGADSIMKLLRITSKHELKLIEKGTAYGAIVREAARKLLRQ